MLLLWQAMRVDADDFRIEQLESRVLLSHSLVKDINSRPGLIAPSKAVTAGETAFFMHAEFNQNRELWASDGTESGTRLVKDIVPGPDGSRPASIIPAGTNVVFTIDSQEFWRSDGTESGTHALNINPTGPDNVSSLTAVGALAFFFANDGVNGNELWRTDGTAAGTFRLTQLGAGSAGVTPGFLGAVGSKLFFSLSNQSGLFTSDGTVAGTAKVPGTAMNVTSPFGSVHNTAFFVGTNDFLWRSDGTSAGTTMVASAVSNLISIVGSGESIFIVRSTTTGGQPSLYRFKEGAGLQLVQTLTGALLTPADLTDVNGTLYLTGASVAGQKRLFRVAPSASAVMMTNGTSFSPQTPADLVNVNGTLYFSGGADNLDLYKVSGPSSNIVLVKSFPFDSTVGKPHSLAARGDQLFFIRDDRTWGIEPFVSDGTAAGTTLLKNVCLNTQGSFPRHLTIFGQKTIFSADDGHSGNEPWVSDGTAAGTLLLKDVRSGYLPSDPTDFTVTAIGVFFRARQQSGFDLWLTDGTPAGTTRIGAYGLSGLRILEHTGSFLFFFADDGVHGQELWRTDGTVAGTQMVSEIRPGASGISSEGGTVHNGVLYFGADDGVVGRELWRSDGTAAGTYLLADINSNPGQSSTPGNLFTKFGDLLYFSATSGTAGNELFATDGTTAGTRLAVDIAPGSGGSSPGFTAGIFRFQNRIYFSAGSPLGTELWASDGTATGTNLVKDLMPGEQSGEPMGFVEFNGELYFSARTAPNLSRQLWKTDGTTSGTRLVFRADEHIALEGVMPAFGRLFFTSRPSSSSPSELYSTDGVGTPADSRIVEQLSSVGTGGLGTFLALPQGHMLVSGSDGVLSHELWKYADQWAPAVTASRFEPNELTFHFTEAVASSLSVDELTITRISPGPFTVLPPSSLMVSPSADGQSASVRIDHSAADGNYVGVLRAGSVVDSAGLSLQTDQIVNFFILAGDANRDRMVNVSDFATLAGNFNSAGTFSDGDFDYSGQVDIGDFSILASKFNTSLPAPVELPRVGGASGKVFASMPIADDFDLAAELLA